MHEWGKGSTMGGMSEKRIYYPMTTASQRRVLFETWEKTGDVDEACRAARVARRTFYNWKKRFETGGYATLEVGRSHAPEKLHTVGSAVEAEVLAVRRAHPDWGKKRIADEVAKQHSWHRVVSPNTVKRILAGAGLWSQTPRPKKGGGLPAGRPRSRAKA